MTGMEPAVAMALSTAASTGVSMIQAGQQAKSQQKAMNLQARQRLEAMEKEREIARRTTQQKLKQDLATRRARFGASGLVSSPSADAILLNLRKATEQRLSDYDWTHNRSVQSIHDGLSSSVPKTNLLDFAPNLIDGFSGIAHSLSAKPAARHSSPRNPHK